MVALVARIGGLVRRYDAYIRDEARCPAAERRQASFAVRWPWGLAVFICVILLRLFGRAVWMAIPFAGVLMIAYIFVGVRFGRYASEFDRAAPDASWAKTEKASVLIAALNRLATGPTSTLTLQARLQEDRGMSAQDLTELFAILRQNGELDDRAVERARRGGLTIGELLESIHMRSAPARVP